MNCWNFWFTTTMTKQKIFPSIIIHGHKERFDNYLNSKRDKLFLPAKKYANILLKCPVPASQDLEVLWAFRTPTREQQLVHKTQAYINYSSPCTSYFPFRSRSRIRPRQLGHHVPLSELPYSLGFSRDKFRHFPCGTPNLEAKQKSSGR